MGGEMPPAKKLKFEPVVEKKLEDSSGLNENQVPEPHVDVAVSPKTERVIPPEMWAKIFEDLPSMDLKTVINTCPEWNKLLSFQKPSFLFPKVLVCMRGWLLKNDLLLLRLINKECKAGVDLAHPENLTRIAVQQEREGRLEEIRRLIRVELQRLERIPVEMDNHAAGHAEIEAIVWENRHSRERLRRLRSFQNFIREMNSFVPKPP